MSDTAFAAADKDRSGPAIKDIVLQHGHECVQARIVPDDEAHIRDAVKSWAEQGGVDWIVTTGGTGFGVRDRTPEVRVLCGSS